MVSKYAHEYELVPESCHPYEQISTGNCEYCDKSKLDKLYKVGDYYVVGGAYGKSNERNIMVEIMNNGPVAIALGAEYDF